MNHYCPRFHAHIAQGLILEAKVLNEMILDPGAEVMNVDRMPSPSSSAPARQVMNVDRMTPEQRPRRWWKKFYCYMSVDDTILL